MHRTIKLTGYMGPLSLSARPLTQQSDIAHWSDSLMHY